MKTYIETRNAIKELIQTVGLNNIKNYHLNFLTQGGHNVRNLENAMNYFMYSPSTKKYRQNKMEER